MIPIQKELLPMFWEPQIVLRHQPQTRKPLQGFPLGGLVCLHVDVLRDTAVGMAQNLLHHLDVLTRLPQEAANQINDPALVLWHRPLHNSHQQRFQQRACSGLQWNVDSTAGTPERMAE